MSKLKKSTLLFYLKRSSFVHIILLSFTLIGGKIVFEIQKKHEKENLEIVSASVRVDVVEMPKYTLSELKKMKPEETQQEAIKEPVKEPIKEEVKEKDKVKDKVKEEVKEKEGAKDKVEALQENSKIKRQSFLNKLKEIGNKKPSKEIKNKAENTVDFKGLVVAGNKLSKGVAIYGEGNTENLDDLRIYASRLPDLVRPSWRLPSFLLDKKLKCRVRIWIRANGEVSNAEIYQSSGDNEYDQRAIEAIMSASPFPVLSSILEKYGLNGKVVLGFPL